MTQAGSIKVIEEDAAEELDIASPTAAPQAIRRRAQNSPFSHEQIIDSCNATKYAVHLGHNITLFLITFAFAITAMYLAAVYNEEIEHYLRNVLKNDRRVIVLFSVIYIICGIFFIPLGIPTFFASFIFTWKWGFQKGFPICFIFNFFFWHLSHLAVFLVGRYFLFDFISLRWKGYQSLEVLKYTVRKHAAWIHF